MDYLHNILALMVIIALFSPFMLDLKQVLNASPDGYTIGYTPLGPLVFQPHMRNQPSNVDVVACIGQDVNSAHVVLVSE